MKNLIKKVFLTVMALIACVVIICLGFWLIDGRSPQAYFVAHALPQTTMEDYEKGKGDTTDKSIVEIPDGVEFPREVKQYKVGSMQVFESAAEDDSKPIVLLYPRWSLCKQLLVGALVGDGRMGRDNRVWHRDAQLSPAFPLYRQGCPSTDASALSTTAGALPCQAHHDYGRFCRRWFRPGLDTGVEG